MSVSGVIERDEMSTALQLLARVRSTGVFAASTTYANALLGFRDGEILWANSSAGPKLGEILVERGLLRRDKLDAALWVQKQDLTWRALGLVLLDVKVVPQSAVELALEEQLTTVLDRVLRWDHGTFRFDPREPETGEIVLPPCGDVGQLQVRVAMLLR